MTVLSLFLLACAPLALAFSNTQPIVSWSTHKTLNQYSAKQTHDSARVLKSLLSADSICSHEAVVLIDQPGLHASDLRGLEPSSYVSTALSSAHSSLQLPYVLQSPSDNSTEEYASAVSEMCQSQLAVFELGRGGDALVAGKKYTVVIHMPALGSWTENSRREDVAYNDNILSTALTNILKDLPNHLVVYKGSPSPESSGLDGRRVFGYNGSQSKSNGIFASYQILSTGVIMGVVVFAFLLLPIAFFGISAVASIQTPTIKADASKTWSATERKNQ